MYQVKFSQNILDVFSSDYHIICRVLMLERSAITDCVCFLTLSSVSTVQRRIILFVNKKNSQKNINKDKFTAFHIVQVDMQCSKFCFVFQYKTCVSVFFYYLLSDKTKMLLTIKPDLK